MQELCSSVFSVPLWWDVDVLGLDLLVAVRWDFLEAEEFEGIYIRIKSKNLDLYTDVSFKSTVSEIKLKSMDRGPDSRCLFITRQLWMLPRPPVRVRFTILSRG